MSVALMELHLVVELRCYGYSCLWRWVHVFLGRATKTVQATRKISVPYSV